MRIHSDNTSYPRPCFKISLHWCWQYREMRVRNARGLRLSKTLSLFATTDLSWAVPLSTVLAMIPACQWYTFLTDPVLSPKSICFVTWYSEIRLSLNCLSGYRFDGLGYRRTLRYTVWYRWWCLTPFFMKSTSEPEHYVQCKRQYGHALLASWCHFCPLF